VTAQFSEDVGEVLAGGKAEVEGDFGDRAIAGAEELGGQFDPVPHEVLPGSLPKIAAKDLGEMRNGNAAERGQLIEPPRCVRASVNEFAGAERGRVRRQVGFKFWAAREKTVDFQAESAEIIADSDLFGGIIQGQLTDQPAKRRL